MSPSVLATKMPMRFATGGQPIAFEETVGDRDWIGYQVARAEAWSGGFEVQRDGIAAGLRPRAIMSCQVCGSWESGHACSPWAPFFVLLRHLFVYGEER